MKISNIVCTDINACFTNVVCQDPNVISIHHEKNNHILYYLSDYDKDGNMITDSLDVETILIEPIQTGTINILFSKLKSKLSALVGK
jgi:hypothetical protein